MKDFLNELADQEAVSRNPFKAFAAYTALKFEDVDEKCKDVTNRITKNEKEITSLQENKLDDSTYNAFLRDYDTFKSTMKVYVIVGTIIINVIFALLAYILKIPL